MHFPYCASFWHAFSGEHQTPAQSLSWHRLLLMTVVTAVLPLVDNVLTATLRTLNALVVLRLHGHLFVCLTSEYATLSSRRQGHLLLG